MIEVPPAPATVETAVARANQLAYGFEKHQDVEYWRHLGYEGDRPYFWKRLLGWQAGGADVARFGLYAEPPSPWNEPAAPPALPNPPDPPAVAALLQQLIDAVQVEVLQQHTLSQKLDALNTTITKLVKSGIKVHA